MAADPAAGTLLRSAEAAGADLALCPRGGAYNDKTLRAGMGAHFRLPLRVCGLGEYGRRFRWPRIYG